MPAAACNLNERLACKLEEAIEGSDFLRGPHHHSRT